MFKETKENTKKKQKLEEWPKNNNYNIKTKRT